MAASIRTLSTAAGTVHVFDNAIAASHYAGNLVAETIRATSGRAVLGLATGGSPIRVYEHLVHLHRAGELSFRDVTTFNLDEYYPISPLDPRSYHAYMHAHLFAHVDVAPNRAHVLDGTVPEVFTAKVCNAYEEWITASGGLDLQLLGIGRNGHIGFNEPSTLKLEEALRLPTRSIELHPTTIADAASEFGGDPANVPRRALTLGVGSILAARSLVVLAFGANKTEALTQAVRGPITAELPASLLQTVAARVTWVVDQAAARMLL